MPFHRQKLPDSPVSQGSFLWRSKLQLIWRKPQIWGLLVLVLLICLSVESISGGGKAQAASPTRSTQTPTRTPTPSPTPSPTPITQTTTRTFPVGAQPDLSITDTDAGFIHVHTGSDNTVVITATITSASSPLPTVNYATPDSNHIIVTVTDNSPTSNLNQVDFDVTVPASIDLELSNTAGGIAIFDGIQGTVHLQSNTGGISLSNTTLIGNGSIVTQNGPITFTGSIAQGAAYQLQSSTGGITVTLPSDTNCHVDARTNNGPIQSDFSEIHIHTTGVVGHDAEGDIGSSNPSATLSLVTSTGPIAIDEAAN